jgi:hypothetical protein
MKRLSFAQLIRLTLPNEKWRKRVVLTVTVAVYGVVSHKASHTLRPLLIYYASPPEFLSLLIHPPELSVFGFLRGIQICSTTPFEEK